MDLFGKSFGDQVKNIRASPAQPYDRNALVLQLTGDVRDARSARSRVRIQKNGIGVCVSWPPDLGPLVKVEKAPFCRVDGADYEQDETDD